MKKRRCHGKTLLVPARQVFRQTVKDIFQIELLAELPDPFRKSPLRYAIDAAEEFQIIQDGHMAVEGKLLRHIPDIRTRLRPCLSKVDACDGKKAACFRKKAAEHFERRRLACTVRP